MKWRDKARRLRKRNVLLEKETVTRLRKRRTLTWDIVVKNTDIEGKQRLVLWFLLDNMTKDDSALLYQEEKWVVIWPSQKGLAIQTGFDRGTAKRAIETAIRLGYIEKLSPGNGFSGASEYRVMSLKLIRERNAQ